MPKILLRDGLAAPPPPLGDAPGLVRMTDGILAGAPRAVSRFLKL
jgi:hypothetical protein